MILEEFILKATEIHGVLYRYSNFTKMHNLVNIECSEHGEFTRLAKNHIYLKQGCPKCFPRIPGCRLTINGFIKKAIKVHGSKYDYTNVKYKSIKEKVKIICLDHGEFLQTPQNHIYNKNGCLECSGNKVKDNMWFIEMGNLIHNNKYNYSKIKYTNSKEKVCILCPEHGEFFQNSLTHIHLKAGCPICSSSRGELQIIKLLNDINIPFKKEYKFKDCINIRKLPFDFFLPDQNTVIEFDGIQHFKAVDFFGGEKGLKYCQKHDKIKNEYCEKNNIKLIRIKYNDNIEECLGGHLGNR